MRFYEITLLETDLPRAKIRVTCSKGTYIRTLCSDIGARLGCKACMGASGADPVRRGSPWRIPEL